MEYQNSISYSGGKVLALSHLLRKVFLLMGLGVGVTAVVAWYFANNQALFSMLVNERGVSGLGIGVMFAPLIFVLIMSFGYQRLSAAALALLFGAYSLINGVSFSFIFMVYTAASVYKTFAIAAAMFLIMAVLGYTTKVDLSRFGSIMIMGLFGLIAASLVNLFMKSAALDYFISMAGVIIFTGLTAWDVQKIKRLGDTMGSYGEAFNKLAVMGALTLYLDFINLFLFLLRFFGNRK
ncbi:MAG: Bax inhibitor-1/YccA family protein [Bacteroidales bacterium]|nr:Bax inhibitor-1/YccA family protein [Bacteroidales bacterium]MDD3011232.1 Bax inhibitor-1/YccA family protein [Bacteroidales bacterium]MDD3961124.1 Bax inhibitor-1/YccA family protein [Bacteroidales bacterium]MDY0284939.1 Bax inhibitor-1/YccA family protein [Bacteroidales bacterium]HPE85895.1 Bax inhibitor-1/YccA family protein [Bacteroidales bacterium]